MILNSYDDICNAYVDLVQSFEKEYGSNAEAWPKETIQKNAKVMFLNRLLKIYNRYIDRAANHGYIGVGRITYSEYYLRRFQLRIGYGI